MRHSRRGSPGPGWSYGVQLFLVGILPLAGFCAFGQPGPTSDPPNPGIAGHYTLDGINRDQSTYSGTVEISALGDRLYWLEWRDPDGSYTGKGSLVGDTLYAVWGSAEAHCSVVFFSVGADGSLDGFWFLAQDRTPERGTITARPEGQRAEGDLEGRYAVTATVLRGSTFPPILEVAALDDGYFRFRWEGDGARKGIGLLDVDQIQVVVSPAAGEGQCGKSEMTLDADGNLTGTWMINDDNFRTLGREKMTRQ